ncbi:MAG: phosphopyruvate hydratase [Clostridiales bacterium]|nr:phosphopyruvate hydratase [Clostridiales bacterium]
MIRLDAMEILDSRGQPTLAVAARLEDGTQAWARVPSGASTGSKEALELRDGDPERFLGKGVERAVAHVLGPLQDAIAGLSPYRQEEIDRALREADGTPAKSRLGANAILGVSMAVARAAAKSRGVPLYRYWKPRGPYRLPVPLLNVINGGRHADNNLDLQEFMLVPHGFPTFRRALQAAAEIYQHLKNHLREKGLSTGVGDEGGFAPDLKSDEEALELLVAAIERAGYRPEKEVSLAIDAAASELGEKGRYRVQGEALESFGLVALYQRWSRLYPIVSLEDGLGEDDPSGWKALNQALGAQWQLVGDDLFVTQKELILWGQRENLANAVLIKPNQVGTLTETWEALEACEKAGWRAIISHRSGETEDTTIADLAVASGAGQIKTGAPARGERTAKYNRLLLIEKELGDEAVYAGPELFPR